MRTFQLPGIERTVPNVVLGLMRIQDKTDDEVRALVSAALDAGIDFVDHADIYGSSLHGCERRFGEAMRLTASERERLTIQTKCGIVRDGVALIGSMPRTRPGAAASGRSAAATSTTPPMVRSPIVAGRAPLSSAMSPQGRRSSSTVSSRSITLWAMVLTGWLLRRL